MNVQGEFSKHRHNQARENSFTAGGLFKQLINQNPSSLVSVKSTDVFEASILLSVPAFVPRHQEE